MLAWWSSLSTVMQVLWAVTLSATLIFVIQSVMTFIGIGGDGGIDTDFDASPDVDLGGGDGSFDADPSMNLLTFRNLVNFCLGFGWTAVLLRNTIKSDALLLTVAVLVGIGLVVVVMLLFKWLSGMQQSGNIDLRSSAVGCEGNVYLTIPAARSGEGKVQISINGAVREYDAVTDGDAIKTGTAIKVVDVLNDSTVLVEELDPAII